MLQFYVHPFPRPQVSYGSRVIATKPDVWTQMNNHDNPMPIRLQLRPILTLFTPEFMTVRRIVAEDGKPIQSHAILSWMWPRYENICKMYSSGTGDRDLCSDGKGCFWGEGCKRNVERCVDDPTEEEKGYRCLYEGCPKDRKICTEPGTMCEEDPSTPRGYRCVQACSTDDKCRSDI